MQPEYWYRQNETALFPDLLWSKPENKRQAGKLLVIGGNVHGMSAPAEAHQSAMTAGVGIVKVLLPDMLAKTIGTHVEHVAFAPSNKSGGFSKNALGEWLDYAGWADAVMLAGDTARNSETAIVMESFVQKYPGLLSITQDCLDQFIGQPSKLFMRPDTLIVASFAQLQKMWPRVTPDLKPPLYSYSLMQNIELLHQFSQKIPAFVITKQHEELIVAARGSVSTTHNETDIWRISTTAKATVWWLQHISQPFEALSTAVQNSN